MSVGYTVVATRAPGVEPVAVETAPGVRRSRGLWACDGRGGPDTADLA
ncbi:hypothetical protein [Streptomyces beihaiensis]|uniref:Uncharacterized protein n=1 Tax=Streptomyces beihaiensis TaxID=2984495 RepID=A0ABT3TYV5_9ACTN|nr:hypothetical protein [Streptomyces beihaiensis]MCX3061168.1 hypothetical protein [Streptomyces beihaiensis]